MLRTIDKLLAVLTLVGVSYCPRQRRDGRGLAHECLFCEFLCVFLPHIFFYRRDSGAGLAKCAGNAASAEKAARDESGSSDPQATG